MFGEFCVFISSAMWPSDAITLISLISMKYFMARSLINCWLNYLYLFVTDLHMGIIYDSEHISGICLPGTPDKRACVRGLSPSISQWVRRFSVWASALVTSVARKLINLVIKMRSYFLRASSLSKCHITWHHLGYKMNSTHWACIHISYMRY